MTVVGAVWVGGWSPKNHVLLNSKTGAAMEEFTPAVGGYGCLVDGNNVLWGADVGQAQIFRKPAGQAVQYVGLTHRSYGLGLDKSTSRAALYRTIP